MNKVSNQSEVARILSQIEAEFYAAQNGLEGFAASSRHQAITARMENLGRLQESLQAIAGDEGTKLFVECLNKAKGPV